MKDRIITIIICVVVSVSILALVIILPGCLDDAIRDQYNGGVCRDCGGNWHLVGVAGHHSSTTYVYECDKCYKTMSSNYPLQ